MVLSFVFDREGNSSGASLLKVLREEGFPGAAQTAAFLEEGLALKVSLLCRLRGRFALLPSGFRVPPLCFVSQQLTRPGWALFPPFSLPCDVLNCLLTDVIQPLRDSFCLVGETG